MRHRGGVCERRANGGKRELRRAILLAPRRWLRVHSPAMTTLKSRFCCALFWLVPFAPVAVEAQVTELPQTVAPGRLLVRMDGLKLSYGREDAVGNTHNALAVASTTVRAGLTQSVDLQVGFDFFLKESITFRGARNAHSGLGDVSLRTKWTFWRDDKIGAAAAVLPYVKLPSSTAGVGTDAITGGIILPWAMQTGAGVTAGAMFQWDVVRNDARNGYDARWYASGFARRDLTKVFSVYGETTLEASSTGLSNWAGTIGGGVLWRLTKSLQFDYELQRGLNDRASAWAHILRLNWEW
ncbi:MAG: transporter [Opitutus sp.]|nr:transporter [Opitutus sp.]